MKSIYDWIVKYEAADQWRRSAFIWFNLIILVVFILLTVLPLDLPLYIHIGRRIRLDYLLHILAFAFYTSAQMVLLPVRWRTIPMISIIALYTLAMAIGIEWVQKFTGFRRFSRRDMEFSLKGIAIGLFIGIVLNLIMALVKRVSDPVKRPRSTPDAPVCPYSLKNAE